jgi:AraC family transcriptional regulator, transcriptional activator of pobA
LSDIPHYFLYGETAPSDALNYIYIASLEESLPKHNWEIHPHRHDNLHQLLVVEQGSVLVQMHDFSSEVSGPCILSIPPKEVHGFVHQPGVRGYIVTIVESYLHGVFAETERQKFPNLFNEALVIRLDPDKKVSWDFEMLMLRVIEEYRNQKPGQTCVIGAYLKIIFVLLGRLSYQNQTPGHHNDARIKIYESFLKLMEQHFTEHWAVSQYADELGLTNGRLNRICQRFTGQNAMQIIHGHVISEAKRKLIYLDMSMNEVAYDLGFKDPAYFSRFFAKHCNEPPGKFKLRMREPGHKRHEQA